MGVAYGPRTPNKDELILYIDSNNFKSWSYNVHPKPINIAQWATVGTRCTLSADSTIVDSPVNGTPMKMVPTSADPYTNSYGASQWNLAPAANGDTWTISVYAKASAQTYGELFIMGASAAGALIQPLSTQITIETTWNRFSYTGTFTSASIANVQMRVDGPNSGYGLDGNTVPTIWWDGLQIEKNSEATRFSSITNANNTSIYDMNLTKNHCSLFGSATHDRTTTPNSFKTNAVSTAAASYLATPTVTFLDKSGYTLDFWIKLRSSATATFHSLSGGLTSTSWLLLYNNNTIGDNWYIRFREANGTYNDFSVVTDWNVIDNWANVTITCDSNRVMSFYLNGQLREQIVIGTSSYFQIKAILGGYSSGGTYYPFQGSLGLSRVYSRTLLESDVKSLFASARGRFGI